MVINTINSYGVDNQVLPSSPFVSYMVYPQSSANSAQMPAQVLSSTKSMQPTWVLNNSQGVGVPQYVLESQLQWALTFPAESVGTQTALYQGSPVVVFDCPRAVQLTFGIATTVATTITVNGWDVYDTPMLESSTVSSGVTSYTGIKAFSRVKSIYFSSFPWSSSGQTVLVRGANYIGLPYFVNSAQTVVLAYWNGALLSTSLVEIGNLWRTTNPYEAGSDARGMINLSSASPLPNGTTQLQVNFYAYGLDQAVDKQLHNVLTQPTGTMTYNYNPNNTIGSSLQIAGIVNNKLARLVNQDRFGAQFPGDQDFMTYYGTL